MSLTIRSRSRKSQNDPTADFWSKLQQVFGEIPTLIRMILELNGFESLRSLRTIKWLMNKDERDSFFKDLEDSVKSLTELDDDDPTKISFREELSRNKQTMEKYKLKLGHKSLIIDLCHEIQKSNIDELDTSQYTTTITVPETKRQSFTEELVVRKHQTVGSEEHGYSREEEFQEELHENQEDNNRSQSPPVKRIKLDSVNEEETVEPNTIQYVYEDEEGNQFIDQEYIDDDSEIVEYHEVTEDTNGLYTAEQIVKSEADHFEQNDSIYYDMSNFNSSATVKTEKSKKPVHMYTEEFLQMQMQSGRIGTPGRRRPKIQKNYSDTEEGLLERWADLVRQSCEVIVPHELLSQYDLSQIDIVKISTNIWEVKCPMCSKKLRLQLTHEGKYVNFKRSNFERHLRIVHFKQIQVFKSEEQEVLLEEISTD
ncbi:hypothetical protein PVAND_003169 [Polypedilum vanderplanki]|uniref:Uncharacterized protein n=1 Tax=Polypedilum vanderplanki TaxID=319348 RepID=A0A9J6BT86_POLVA|nr:hypothetical protein PVAND_003169 [Polypedilum vanderplanki]